MRRFMAAASIVLTACAELSLQLPPTLDSVVHEVVEAARAPAAQQKAVLADAQRDFARDPSPMHRVRLAALLATLPEPVHDDARALELLEPIVETASAAGRFAAFLSAHITERQRLMREGEKLAKERAAAEREHQNAEKERDKREEALRQQLEALRAIERGILEREERLRKKPGVKP
ncbi:MAG TPA: hypothetical protein VIQ55_03935 [Burkholderiales bacterium]